MITAICDFEEYVSHGALQEDEKHFLIVFRAKLLRFLFRRIQQSPVTRLTEREARSITSSVACIWDTPTIIRVPTHSEIKPEEKLKSLN